MKKNNKGGVATIVAVILMVGIVLALILSTVIPMANKGRDTGATGVGMLSDLQGKMTP